MYGLLRYAVATRRSYGRCHSLHFIAFRAVSPAPTSIGGAGSSAVGPLGDRRLEAVPAGRCSGSGPPGGAAWISVGHISRRISVGYTPHDLRIHRRTIVYLLHDSDMIEGSVWQWAYNFGTAAPLAS